MKTDFFEKMKGPIITLFIIFAAIGAFLADWKTVFSSQAPAPPRAMNPAPSPVAALQSPPPVTVISSSPVPTRMTPEEIVAELDKQPPMMQQGFAAEFNGVPFEWTLQFWKTEAEEKHIRVGLNPETGWPLVIGTLPLARSAELKTVPSGAKVRVKGTIESLDSTVNISVNISEFVILRP